MACWRSPIWGVGALIACAQLALASAGCAPDCATDDDCGAGAICVNGQCQKLAAPASDAAPAHDAALADHASGDAAGFDQRRSDSAPGHDSAPPRDSATPHDATAATDAAGSDANTYPGQIGAACQGSGECTTPFDAYCDLSAPGGYCTAGCTYGGSSLQCGSHADCYCTFSDGSGCAEARCFRTCWFYNECRDGYSCDSPDWFNVEGSDDLCYHY